MDMARVLIGNFKGPEGPRGQQGEPGEQGPRGAVGPPGEDGSISEFTSVPEDFGAVGDGVTNDTVAIQNMFSSGAKSFYIPKKDYLMNDGVTIDDENVKITCDGVFLFTDYNDVCFTIDADNCHLELNIDGNNTARVGVNNFGRNNTVTNCNISNLYSDSDGVFGVNTTQNGLTTISHNNIKNLYAEGNEIMGDNNGASRGVRVYGRNTNDGKTVIEGNVIQDVLGEEGDSIQTMSSADQTTGMFEFMDVIIKGNTIKNFSRRAIKLQSSGGQVLSNNIINLSTYDNLIRTIDIQMGDDTVVKDNVVNTSNTPFIGINGKDDTQKVSGVKILNNSVNMDGLDLSVYTNFVEDMVLESNVFNGGGQLMLHRCGESVIKDNTIENNESEAYTISNIISGDNMVFMGNLIKGSTYENAMRTNSVGVKIFNNSFLGLGGSGVRLTGGSGHIFNNLSNHTSSISGLTGTHKHGNNTALLEEG